MKKLIPLLFLILFACIGCSQNNTNQEIKHIFVTEEPASFPRGEEKLFSFIKLVKHYPDSAKARRIEGKVYVQFVVKKTGDISDIKILRSPDTLLSQEAIRIVKLMPNWNPGKNLRGDSVDVRMVLPIKFEINHDELYKVLETQPKFPSGDSKLFEFLGKSIKYPELDTQNGIRSKFYLEFIIKKNGSLSNLSLLKNESQEFYKNIALAFNDMPKWNPGIQRGKPVRTKMVLPFRVHLR
jgi:TonB family protein